MSEKWENRQRRTNELIRFCTEYLAQKGNITAKNIYGLCRLTWITSSYDEKNTSYIKSTKIPALSDIFEKDYSTFPMEIISKDISEITEKPLSEVRKLIEEDTGFTNFYKAYRNSSLEWIEQNQTNISNIVKKGYNLESDEDARELIILIDKLPKIHKPTNDDKGKTSPERLLTPLIFSLDKRLRFPIINGSKQVISLLRKLDVKNSSLLEQFDQLIKIIGQGGVKDAADLDQIGEDLPDFIEIPTSLPKKKKLSFLPVNEDTNLSVKDEEDYEILTKSLNIKAKKIHNKLTNKFKENIKNYTLLEGCSKENMFDILVKNYDQKNDLLIEVKSSIEIPDVRMAVGQLMDYRRQLEKFDKTHCAVLLPQEPTDHVINFLNSVNIGLLWYNNDRLQTTNDWITFAEKFKDKAS